MFVNYNDLTRKLTNISEVCILASKEFSHMVEEVYDNITAINPLLSVFIINSDDIICPLKHKITDLVVVLGVECPDHSFPNAAYLEDELTDEEKRSLENIPVLIYDSTFRSEINPAEMHFDREYTVVSKNQSVVRYYSRKYACRSFFNLSFVDRMDYLTRRINISEISKNNQTFAIIFVHEVFKDLALKIKEALDRSGRCGYLLFLRNVRYSRLITIEKIDTLVLIDCPSFDNFNIDVTLPILSPADVQYILTKKWDPEYRINKFDYFPENSEERDICKYEGAGKIILESEFFGIEYSKPEEEDLEIHEGRKGIAGEYEHE